MIDSIVDLTSMLLNLEMELLEEVMQPFTDTEVVNFCVAFFDQIEERFNSGHITIQSIWDVVPWCIGGELAHDLGGELTLNSEKVPN
jgi:hypothetical protein